MTDQKHDIEAPPQATTTSTQEPIVVDGELSLLNASKEIFTHSAVFILCRLIYLGGNVASLAILSHKNKEYLAASGLINTTQTAVLYTSTGVVFIVGILAKAAIARNEDANVGILYHKGVLMSAALGIPAGLATLFIGPVCSLFESSDISSVITKYDMAYAFAMPANILFMNNIQLLLATHNYPVMALQSMIYSAILVPGSYAFLNGTWYMPAMGAFGVGLANVLAAWISSLLTNIYLLLSPGYKKYGLLNFSAVNEQLALKELLKKGIPIGLQGFIETSYTALIAGVMGSLSDEQISASAPVWNVATLISPITFSIAQNAGLLVTQAVAKARYLNARKYGYASLLVSEVVPLINVGLSASVPGFISSIFIDADDRTPEIMHDANIFLLIASLGLAADAIRINAGGSTRGYHSDTTFSMIVALFSVLGVGVTLSTVLAYATPLSGAGLLLGRTTAYGIGGILMGSYWYRKSHSVVDDASSTAESKKTVLQNVGDYLKYYLLCSKTTAADATAIVTASSQPTYNTDTGSSVSTAGSVNEDKKPKKRSYCAIM